MDSLLKGIICPLWSNRNASSAKCEMHLESKECNTFPSLRRALWIYLLQLRKNNHYFGRGVKEDFAEKNEQDHKHTATFKDRRCPASKRGTTSYHFSPSRTRKRRPIRVSIRERYRGLSLLSLLYLFVSLLFNMIQKSTDLLVSFLLKFVVRHALWGLPLSHVLGYVQEILHS